jgi:hypothetical protein
METKQSPLALVVCVVFLYGKKREVCTYTKMNTYIIQFIFAPFLIKYFVKSHCKKTLLWKKALPFLLKSYQNGENLTADKSTMSDPNGKVSIHLGSSWLKVSNDIGLHMVSTESWNQLVTVLLNTL